jgi:molybdopterin synthase sulfur carrier subunit
LAQITTVRLFGTLRKLFDAGELSVDAVDAGDVAALLELVCDNPEKRQGVFFGPGELRNDISVLVNGRNVCFLQGLMTELRAGDVVAIVPPMAGG